jgi:hypothetical protein
VRSISNPRLFIHLLESNKRRRGVPFLLLRKFQKVPNPKGTELGKVQGIGAKHNVGRPHNGPLRSYPQRGGGCACICSCPKASSISTGDGLPIAPHTKGQGDTKERLATVWIASALQEEDKKRGYGLIGKTTILHIVNSGSRPDISIFVFFFF